MGVVRRDKLRSSAPVSTRFQRFGTSSGRCLINYVAALVKPIDALVSNVIFNLPRLSESVRSAVRGASYALHVLVPCYFVRRRLYL